MSISLHEVADTGLIVVILGGNPYVGVRFSSLEKDRVAAV
jgi:hypothetical protein